MSKEKRSTARLVGPEECQSLRDALVRKWIVPRVETVFERFPAVQSAILAVAQYWNDEANDAVHPIVLYSTRQDPDFDAYVVSAPRDEEGVDDDDVQVAWENLLEGPQPDLDHWELVRLEPDWPSNHDAIPAFAAFCAEGASQEMHPWDCYVPYAVLRRGQTGVQVEIVGTMLRPWLDGLAPEWSMPTEG